MTVYHGKVSTFKIDSNDLSNYITDVDSPFSADVAESTAKGSTSKTYVEGHFGGTITISGRWDDTVTTGPDAVLEGLWGDGANAFEIGYGGDANGQVIYTGNAILTGYTPTSPLAGVVGFSATFQITGDVTRTTVGV